MSAHRKTLCLDRLLALRAQARLAGKTVVHCHGCFDIVHPGHIHHLESARALGDLLIVSVSSDANVNKGPDRPLIPDDLRAASLGALECVDAVYINPDPTAVELLGRLQPDIFVKGREYQTSADPRFLAERDAVTAAGGRVEFSSADVVYSSTSIISSIARDDFEAHKIGRFRQRHALADATLANLVARLRGLRIVVVGDHLLDRYHFCDATGIAGEAPMMSLRCMEQTDYDGGAAIIARHLAALGAAPTLLCHLPDGADADATLARLACEGVGVDALRHRRGGVAKHRYLVDGQKMMKVDHGAPAALDSRDEATVADRLFEAADGADAVIFADFGYGMVTPGLLERVLPRLRASVPILAADVSGRQANLLQFKGFDLLCPTERELRDTLHDYHGGLNAVVWNLLHQTRSRQALITLGKRGLLTFDWPTDAAGADGRRLRSDYLPAFESRAVDPLGCGDALLATATAVLAAGGSLAAAALLASHAAAFEARQLGNIPVPADALLDCIGFPALVEAA